MQELLVRLTQPATIVFAVSAMFGLGLGVVFAVVVERLKNWRFDLGVLAVNFILVPAAGLLLARLLALSLDLRAGLLLIAFAAGAAIVAKFTQVAGGENASSIALVTLLTVVTVVFMPFALPAVLPGIAVDVAAIVIALTWQMLLPLAAGLIVRARFERSALALRPAAGVVSNIALVLLLVASLGQNLPGVLALGLRGVAAVVLLIASGAFFGYLLAVPAGVERRVMALGSGQRNLAAAFIVAETNFAARPLIPTFIATAGLIMILVLLPLARLFSTMPPGRHLSRDILRSKAASAGR